MGLFGSWAMRGWGALLPAAALLFGGAGEAVAAAYAFQATVASVQAGSQAGDWETIFVVGQPIGGVLRFDESLAPDGFTDPSETTSVFLHAVPNGYGVRVDPPANVERDDGSPHRIERGIAGDDFRMLTSGWMGTAPVEIDFLLADIGAIVDYLTLPDPLAPPLPAAGNEVVLRADPGPGSPCGGPETCTVVAEITSLDPGADTDGDGVPDLEDNCVLDPNGPVSGSCDAQQDGDQDGYGNSCDTDFNNDGATGPDDLSAIIDPVIQGSTDPEFDLNCDGAAGPDDLSSVIHDTVTSALPGPSGYACAGTVPCP